jgi:hypothetical protein
VWVGPSGPETIPYFFKNLQLLSRSFFRILSTRSDLFSKFSAADPFLFHNHQHAIRSFLKILSCRPVPFPEFSARDPIFSGNLPLTARPPGARGTFLTASEIRACTTGIRAGHAAPPAGCPERACS